ncbi:putative Ribonuclease Oy [Corchorus olitorius]|uniref:Ribonuclease Oy n=1 Tax=Corchorus olitorius TaxID=93759 RepID=A0A1R3KRG5_9ROSI|nr:putative Ribonuclease Oy [Corchorus olitorius]
MEGRVGSNVEANQKAIDGVQDVVMAEGQANKNGGNFVFRAGNGSSNNGGESQSNKKWKESGANNCYVGREPEEPGIKSLWQEKGRLEGCNGGREEEE